MTKSISIGIFLGFVCVVTGALFGYALHKTPVQFNAAGTNSAAGTTFNTAKVAQVNITPSTATATSSSILNSDATDRWVLDSFSACNTVGTSLTYLTGTGLAALKLQIATTAAGSQVGNVNFVGNITISTSTPDDYEATSTEGVIKGTSRVWPTGTYMTFFYNATNTAVCTAGVHYIGS